MSSFLLHHEHGRVSLKSFVPCTQDMATSFVLDHPVDAAEVFLFARRLTDDAQTLAFSLASNEYSVTAPPTHYRDGDWLRCAIKPETLHPGENVLVVPPQPGWALAQEDQSGVFVIRLRVEGATVSNETIFPGYGDPAIERNCDEWLKLLPPELQSSNLETDADRWNWCWEVAGFLSSAWVYANCFDGNSYAPWDTRTILAWGRAQQDNEGNKPIVMCVHYAVSLVQLCIAMGIPARVVVLSPGLGSMSGHFVAEVWLDEHQSWVMIDPNMHLAYIEASSGRPLAVAELAARGEALKELAQFGSGWQSQRQRFQSTVEQDYLTGKVYRLWGVWRQHNWIEGPDLAPLAHGAVAYCETDIIWCAEEEVIKKELAMFPHFLTPAELARAPQ